MENRAFEVEQCRNDGSDSTIHMDPGIHPDAHVYEDIGPSREEFCRISSGYHEEATPSRDEENGRLFRTTAFTNDTIEGIIRSDSSQSIYFQRNLTLPFRRGFSPSAATASTSYSIREKRWKSNKERKDRSLNENVVSCSGRGEETNEDRTLARLREGEERLDASGRRRRKDCKHCRNRGNFADSENQERVNDKNAGESWDSCPSSETILSQRNDKFLPLCQALCKNQGESTRQNSSSITIFSISEKVQQEERQRHSPSRTLEYLEYDRTDVETKLAHVAESNEDKALIMSKKYQPSMRINSIYTQDHWYAKEAPIYFTGVKEPSAFQGHISKDNYRSPTLNTSWWNRIKKTIEFKKRAYSLPVRMQTPTSQNRANLRRSVRGEPPPHPARLHKHHRGWTLHLARPLEGSGCNKSFIFLLALVLILLGVGAAALYIVFEPHKLQIIQLYLKSSSGNSSMRNVTSAGESLGPVFLNESKIETTSDASRVADVFLNQLDLSFPDGTASVITETETEAPSHGHANTNSTRYCDDCLSGEVCVGLLDEEVPICRIGLDPEDPTGCAGLCLINKQRCHRLDVDAFRCVEIEHYCLDDEWTCTNTLCIPMEKRCDGHMNCYDHSDEYNCVCNLETHFQCGNDTSCLPLERRCDGRIDCWDASDEINCTLACPLESEFTCSNGQCILRARFCDGLVDCADGSDEPHGCEGRCNKHEFTCQNSRCIAKGAKCNGIDDCGDYSDERHCKNHGI